MGREEPPAPAAPSPGQDFVLAPSGSPQLRDQLGTVIAEGADQP